jgi:ELWxxDGT repeat protein
VDDIDPGSASSSPSWRQDFAGVLYFAADDGTDGYQLWRSDGTLGGTFMVTSAAGFAYLLTVGNGMLFFSGNDGTHGYEPWVSDGTGVGTSMLKDIKPTGRSFPQAFTPVGAEVFFEAWSVHGQEQLWKTDGTSLGTVMVAEIYPARTTYRFASVGNLLLFVEDDGVHGFELWRSIGTSSGTKLVKDIRRGPKSSMFVP